MFCKFKTVVGEKSINTQDGIGHNKETAMSNNQESDKVSFVCFGVCMWSVYNEEAQQRFSQLLFICKSMTQFVGDALVTNNRQMVS